MMNWKNESAARGKDTLFQQQMMTQRELTALDRKKTEERTGNKAQKSGAPT